MKLFQYDSKHDRVISELDLGELSDEQNALLDKVLEWMETRLFTRYNSAVLAESYTESWDDAADSRRVNFK